MIQLTPGLAENFRQPPTALGVLVTDVENGSVAEEIGLLAGDIIHAVNESPTATVASYKQAVHNLKLTNGIVLDILRQGHAIYLSYSKS